MTLSFLSSHGNLYAYRCLILFSNFSLGIGFVHCTGVGVRDGLASTKLPIFELGP